MDEARLPCSSELSNPLMMHLQTMSKRRTTVKEMSNQDKKRKIHQKRQLALYNSQSLWRTIQRVQTFQTMFDAVWLEGKRSQCITSFLRFNKQDMGLTDVQQ